MEITEVRIKLMESAEDRLRGFCSITFDDCFVVRDLKIIEGNNGPFVAMPSRKLTSHCDKCRTKNHLRARFCNQCGARLRNEEIAYDQDGRAKLYADIAHPVNAECREMIQKRVIEELEREIELSSKPGYASRYDDDYDMIQRHRQKTAREPDDKVDKRVDSGHPFDSPQPAPHRPQDTSEQVERQDPSGEAFGRGIFD
jgi:stage V sporulation protein G